MYKESLKHENLKVAYQLQYNTIQELAASNLSYFAEVEASEIKRQALQLKLEKSMEALRKKKSNFVLPAAIGLVGGLVISVVISN